jgi:hypothetical protein
MYRNTKGTSKIDRCLKEVPKLTSTSELNAISPARKIKVKIIAGSRNNLDLLNL